MWPSGKSGKQIGNGRMKLKKSTLPVMIVHWLSQKKIDDKLKVM